MLVEEAIEWFFGFLPNSHRLRSFAGARANFYCFRQPIWLSAVSHVLMCSLEMLEWNANVPDCFPGNEQCQWLGIYSRRKQADN